MNVVFLHDKLDITSNQYLDILKEDKLRAFSLSVCSLREKESLSLIC